MIKTKVVIIFLTIFSGVLIFARTSRAATHYVSPSGSATWANSTNINTPCSLASAFANAAAGDIVYLRGNEGDYVFTTNLITAHDGTAQTKIILEPYNDETVNFTGPVAMIFSKDYWVLNGVNFLNLTGDINGYDPIDLTGYATEIRHCNFDFNYQKPIQGTAIRIYGDSTHNYDGYNIIDHCSFKNFCSLTTPDGESDIISMGYGLPASNHNTISNCTFQNWQAYGIIIWGPSSYNQVLNSIFDNANGYGLAISINDFGHSGSAQHNLVDGNIFENFSRNEAPVTGYWKAAIQLYGDYNSVRRNLFYDFGHKVVGAYWTGGSGIESLSFQHNLIYNNVFYNIDNAGTLAVAETSRRIIGNKYYNNLYYHNMKHINSSGYLEGSQHYWETRGTAQKAQFEADGNKFDYNFLQYVDPDHIIMNWYSGLSINSTIGSMYADLPNTYGDNSGRTHNIQSANGPGVVSLTSGAYDFHLTTGSPLIDAGVVVNDPDWGNLTYSGSAPDIGAFEYVVGGDSTAPSVPTNLTATSVSYSQINLSWTASTDDVGVTGYKIYRNGVQRGTSATNKYSDTGLSASTAYTYTVSAYDAAGNNSAQSSSASATTQALSSATPQAPSLSANTLANVKTYANPYMLGRGGVQDGSTGIVFSGLTNRAEVKIYTISGNLVYEGTKNDGSNRFEWGMKNKSGEAVASGIYIYAVTNPDKPGDKASGKIVIIK